MLRENINYKITFDAQEMRSVSENGGCPIKQTVNSSCFCIGRMAGFETELPSSTCGFPINLDEQGCILFGNKSIQKWQCAVGLYVHSEPKRQSKTTDVLEKILQPSEPCGHHQNISESLSRSVQG